MPTLSKSKKKNTLKCEECGFETEDQDELEEHKRDSTELHRKFGIVLDKNTLFFNDTDYGEKYEVDDIGKRKEDLLDLCNRIKISQSKKKELAKFMQEYDEGLERVLILLGISDEFFKRFIRGSRIFNDPELNKILNLAEWDKTVFDKRPTEWDIDTIQRKIKKNDKVAEGIANLIFEAHKIPILKKRLPTLEMKKFDSTKLEHYSETLIDTILRYSLKGSLSAMGDFNAEEIIAPILTKHSIKWTDGKLPLIPDDITRTMDFIIPDKENPEIIIESSFMVTTSSSMGDKAKTEIQMRRAIAKHYPNATFIGFNDGAGWLSRKKDLRRMVSGQDDVFTFHDDELKRFEDFILKEYPHLCNAEK